MIYTGNLYKEVLIKPAENGADRLKIISGYASPEILERHANDLKDLNLPCNIDLKIGMTPVEGICKKAHQHFLDIQKKYQNNISVSYAVRNPYHSKIYIWLKNNNPDIAFVGSANYTPTGFFNNSKQKEILVKADPVKCLNYYDTVTCVSSLNASNIKIIDCSFKVKNSVFDLEEPLNFNSETILNFSPNTLNVPSVTLPLYSKRTGDVPEKSGLNWGQRTGREPNQAYIHVPTEYRNFFPDRGVKFTVITDDGETLIMVKAQDGGKALETPHNNSELGIYFRKRLGVPPGAPVTLSDLDNYGRRDVDFYKLDPSTYLMNFRAP